MPRPLDWDIGAQLTSVIDPQGFEETQYDAEGEGASGVPSYETHHAHCFWGRALPPVVDAAPDGQPGSGQADPTQAAQMLFAMEGSTGHAWTMEDPRVVATMPTPDPGCGVFYGANMTAGKDGKSLGVCFVRTHNDGRVTISTTTTAGGTDGQTVFQETSPQGFKRVSPYGTELYGQFSGITTYSLSLLGGSNFTMGYAGGLVPGLSSFISLQSDSIEINAAAVSIGPTGAPSGPVALATPLAAALNLTAIALTALQASIAATPTGGAGSVPAVTAAVAALTSLLAEMSTSTNIG